jgi:hypothetical protein
VVFSVEAEWRTSVTFDYSSHVSERDFATLCPEGLPLYVLPFCHFASDQVRSNLHNHTGNPHFLWKTAATILYILYSLPTTSLQVIHVHILTLPFLYFSPKLLTPLVFIPYNVLAFDLHGLIRRLGRLPSDSILFFDRDSLSFEVSSTVGVMVSR